MKKRRRGRFVRESEPSDNPLGIGLSTKTLTIIGVGIVGAILLKMWLEKRKKAAVGLPATSSAAPLDAQLAGMGAINPPSTNAPAGPPPGMPSSAQMPQSPPRVPDSRWSESGGLRGDANGRL